MGEANFGYLDAVALNDGSIVNGLVPAGGDDVGGAAPHLGETRGLGGAGTTHSLEGLRPRTGPNTVYSP